MEPYQPHHIDPSLDQPSKAEAAPETVEEPKSDLLAEDNNKPEKKEKAPAKKGTKRWYKEQAKLKSIERKRSIRNVLNIIDSFNSNYAVCEAV